MEKKTISAIGAAAVIAAGTATAAVAAPDAIPAAASYADLLQNVPQAANLLKADDAARESTPAMLFEAQYNPNGPAAHHHHHHHQRRSRQWYVQHGYMWNGQMWVVRPRHHHHHHHNNGNNG